MVNQQLVDYIKQQIQGGVAREAIKKALLDAGWPPADVDDSMNAAAAVSAAPIETKPAAASVNPAAIMAGGASPEIRPKESAASPTAASLADPPAEEHPRKGLVPLIVMGTVIVLLLGALGYVYFSLSGKLASATTAGGGSGAQLKNLENKIKSLGDEKTSLNTQVIALNAANEGLLAELAFFALPPSGSLSQDIEGKAYGTLSGGGTIPYTLTTEHQLRVYVKNYKDAKVDAILKPLLGKTVEISGTHKPTSPDLTITAVNGAPVNPPAPASTSTEP